MGKIISFFNHKGGVGKTTLVHNLSFALADEGKRVLLIDADPQMNLTSAHYGLSTSIEYSTDVNSKWSQFTQRYISLSEHFRSQLSNPSVPSPKQRFTRPSRNGNGGFVDLISGDINLTNIEADLYGIVKNSNTFTNDIPSRFERSIRAEADKYDFILIDTSPSASSVLNALLVLTSDYFIAPVSPSFFSLQAIDNLITIFNGWTKLLGNFQADFANRDGLNFRVKFLGMVVQLAKRFNGGAAKNIDGFFTSTEEWIADVNESVKKFHEHAMQTGRAISESDFKRIFGVQNIPFVIEKCCDFTSKLRKIAEDKGIPVIYLTQEITGSKADITKETSQYTKTFKQINASYRNIAACFLAL